MPTNDERHRADVAINATGKDIVTANEAKERKKNQAGKFQNRVRTTT